MGFWDNFFKGKVFADKRNPTMVCEMTLCGHQYLLSEFDIGYDTEDTSQRYFGMYAVFEEPISALVENWITNPNRKESGEIKFYRHSDAMDEGALFEVKFRDASCIRYRKSTHNGFSVTTIAMTIPAITMIGEDFEIKQ